MSRFMVVFMSVYVCMCLYVMFYFYKCVCVCMLVCVWLYLCTYVYVSTAVLVSLRNLCTRKWIFFIIERIGLYVQSEVICVFFGALVCARIKCEYVWPELYTPGVTVCALTVCVWLYVCMWCVSYGCDCLHVCVLVCRVCI